MSKRIKTFVIILCVLVISVGITTAVADCTAKADKPVVTSNGDMVEQRLLAVSTDMVDKNSEVYELESFQELKDVEFAVYQWFGEDGSKSSYFLLDDGEIVYTFPEPYGNRKWDFIKIRSVAFRNLNNDNLLDVVVISEYSVLDDEGNDNKIKMIDVYFQEKNRFVQYDYFNKDINSRYNYKKLQTADDVVAYLSDTLLSD